MDIPADSPLAFRFDRLRDTFDQFSAAIAADDQDRAFVLYLKFRTLAKLVAEGATAMAGRPTHFDEEADRVMDWMGYAVGLNPTAGYCHDQSAARYILDGALKWD